MTKIMRYLPLPRTATCSPSLMIRSTLFCLQQCFSLDETLYCLPFDKEEGFNQIFVK